MLSIGAVFTSGISTQLPQNGLMRLDTLMYLQHEQSAKAQCNVFIRLTVYDRTM